MKKITVLSALLIAICAFSASAESWDSKAQQSSAAWTSATTIDTAIAVPVVSYSTVAVSLSATSTMTAGTLNFELSNDNGSTYPYSIACVRTDSATAETTFALSVTNRAWQCSVGGFTHFRIRLNPAITGSGTATLRAQATAAPMQNIAAGMALSGTPASTNQGVPDAGTQRVIVGQKVTYYFSTAAKTATAAGTGPFFAICGSSTKTVRVQRIQVGGTVATAAVYADVQLRKTSAATSAGTATALTKVPADSNAGASTANLLNFYTVLATSGTSVGMVDSQSAVFPLTGTVAASEANVLFDYTNRQESEALVLRGTGQCIEASFGTTTTNAPTLSVAGAYIEEP